MSLNKQVRRIAIIGTGVIGASWAAQYLARGFDVIATNPDPKAESQLRKAWCELRDLEPDNWGCCAYVIDIMLDDYYSSYNNYDRWFGHQYLSVIGCH